MVRPTDTPAIGKRRSNQLSAARAILHAMELYRHFVARLDGGVGQDGQELLILSEDDILAVID